MKLIALSLSLLVLVNACSIRPQRPGAKSKTGSGSIEGVVPPGSVTPGGDPTIPGFVDSNDPLDNYLSVGPYLQKEFDTAESASKTVKVFMQIRQENSLEKNFVSLRELIGPMNPSIPSALDAAQKEGESTVEFEADVASLKTSVTMINNAVSGIEISLPAVK